MEGFQLCMLYACIGIYVRYTFSSNHNIHKSLCGLCLIFQLNGVTPKTKGHMNFKECCDLTKNISRAAYTTTSWSFY